MVVRAVGMVAVAVAMAVDGEAKHTPPPVAVGSAESLEEVATTAARTAGGLATAETEAMAVGATVAAKAMADTVGGEEPGGRCTLIVTPHREAGRYFSTISAFSLLLSPRRS